MTVSESDLWFTTSATASRLGVSSETLERKKEEGCLRRDEHWCYIGSDPSAILWKAEACRESLTKESDRGTSRLNSLNTMEDLSEPGANSDSPINSEQQKKEAIHRLVSSVIGTPEQQREALKVILLENLHSSSARKLMMKYCTEYVESRLKKQLEAILQDQQDFIRRTVKSELDQVKAELRSSAVTDQAKEEKRETKANYHSLVEIRALVTENIDAIQDYFQGRDVCARALFDHLETYTELRPGDREVLTNGNLRWNQQVGNAVRDTEWPDSPFKRSNKRGYYEIEYWRAAP